MQYKTEKSVFSEIFSFANLNDFDDYFIKILENLSTYLAIIIHLCEHEKIAEDRRTDKICEHERIIIHFHKNGYTFRLFL